MEIKISLFSSSFNLSLGYPKVLDSNNLSSEIFFSFCIGRQGAINAFSFISLWKHIRGIIITTIELTMKAHFKYKEGTLKICMYVYVYCIYIYIHIYVLFITWYALHVHNRIPHYYYSECFYFIIRELLEMIVGTELILGTIPALVPACFII